MGAVEDRIVERIAGELARFEVAGRAEAMVLAAFEARRVRRSRPVRVTFPGAVEGIGWTVIRSDGCYSVVYLPEEDLFSLCVDSDFGPLDIGVHGAALACFASV